MGFNYLNIGKRLAIGFALVLAMILIIAGTGAWRLQQVATDTRSMMRQSLAKERMIADWYTNVFGAVRRTAAIVRSSDTTLADFFKDDTVLTTTEGTRLIKLIEPLLTPGPEQQLYERIVAQRAVYTKSRDAAIKVKAADAAESTRIFEQQVVPASKAYQDLLNELVGMQRQQIDAAAAAIDAGTTASTEWMMALTLGAVLLGILCCWRLTSGIVGPIRIAVGVAETVAAGDLSQPIDDAARDETGALLRALRTMRDSLTAIVTEVRDGTETIATASNQISAGNLDLSSRTEQQASALEETAASMEELTTTVRNNADNARQANTLSIKASDVAVQGGAVVSQVIDTMGAISEASRKIVDIIAVIDGIAFQTNILALNAAVEAARAGEQGRGFAVVASEVRTLAQRSAAAAKEIKELIGASSEQVEAGTRLVDRAGATMEEVVSSIRRVTDIMGEITTATQEQSGGIEQVNQAIGQMDEATQQNAALVEESAAAAASMQEQALLLAEVVGVFKLESVEVPLMRPQLLRPVPMVRKPVPALAQPVVAVATVFAAAAPARPPRARPASATAPNRAAPAVAAASDEWEEF